MVDTPLEDYLAAVRPEAHGTVRALVAAIDAALALGLKRVEAGAQGAHKLARGYLPTPTYSLHYIANEGFRRAVEDYLERERAAVDEEIEFLLDKGPFRKAPGA